MENIARETNSVVCVLIEKKEGGDKLVVYTQGGEINKSVNNAFNCRTRNWLSYANTWEISAYEPNGLRVSEVKDSLEVQET